MLEPVRVIAENSGFEGAVILEKISTSKQENYGFDAQSDKYGNMITMEVLLIQQKLQEQLLKTLLQLLV